MLQYYLVQGTSTSKHEEGRGNEDMIKKSQFNLFGNSIFGREILCKDRPGPAWEGLQFQTKKSRLCSLGRTEGFDTGLYRKVLDLRKSSSSFMAAESYMEVGLGQRRPVWMVLQEPRGAVMSSHIDGNQDRHLGWKERRSTSEWPVRSHHLCSLRSHI